MDPTTTSYDFLSYPHNPEDYYQLLYIIDKNENYEIYKAIHNESREIFAIKIIPFDNRISYQKLKQEALIMRSLKNCDSVIKYHSSFLSFKLKNIWLIYEYCPSGSIYDLLKVIERPLIEQEISVIINDILHALIYMYQLNIVHGNIKLTNILLTENAKAKLGNFTCTNQQINNLLSSKGQTIKNRNDPKYDIFLLGIICIELFKGIDHFDRNQFMEEIKNNKNNKNAINTIIEKYFFVGSEQLCSQEFIDFIKKCLDTNMYKRPTAFELKNHSFIKNNINSNNSEKIYFLNLIKYNIEKIEYNKKVKYNNKKSSTHLSKSNFNFETLNSHNNDKIAEFNFQQMGNDENEYDKYSNKDYLVDNSNLDNTGFHYYTDDSLDKSLKQSAVFGKGEFKRKKSNHKTVAYQKLSFLKNLLKEKEKQSMLLKNNISNKDIKNINDYENIINKKESEDIDIFKENWEHLNRYKEILKTKNSNNKIDIFNFTDESFDMNNMNMSINNNSINNNYSINDDYNINKNSFVPFSDMKCNVIQLGYTIKKYRTDQKQYNDSEYSLKNSTSKLNEIKEFSLKNSINKHNLNNGIYNKNNNSQKLLLSFKNNVFNDIDNNLKKSLNKDKVFKNDISTTYFSSFNSPINKGSMEIKSEKYYSYRPFALRKKKFEENLFNGINNKNYNNNEIEINILKKSESEYNFLKEKSNKKPYLYKYIKELDNQKNGILKKYNKSNIIRVNKIFNNKEKSLVKKKCY